MVNQNRWGSGSSSLDLRLDDLIKRWSSFSRMGWKLSNLNSVQEHCGRGVSAVDARRLSIFCVSICRKSSADKVRYKVMRARSTSGKPEIDKDCCGANIALGTSRNCISPLYPLSLRHAVALHYHLPAASRISNSLDAATLRVAWTVLYEAFDYFSNKVGSVWSANVGDDYWTLPESWNRQRSRYNATWPGVVKKEMAKTKFGVVEHERPVTEQVCQQGANAQLILLPQEESRLRHSVAVDHALAVIV